MTEHHFDLDKATDEELRAIHSQILRRLIDRAKAAGGRPDDVAPYDRHHSVHSRNANQGQTALEDQRSQSRYVSSLGPFVPTPHDVVDRLLRFAEINEQDTVYDLGCGDGRCVVSAAETYGARGVGVDIDEHCVRLCEANARAAGVEDLTRFEVADAMTVDVSSATVVVLYLLHWPTLQLRPMLTRCLRPGARIVSHGRGMGDWPPDETDSFVSADGAATTLYLWVADGKERL